MTCVDEATIVAMLRGQLPEAEVVRVDAHVDECASCRELLTTLARASWMEPALPTPEALETTGASLAGAPESLVRGDALGRYVILGPVGAGGMGVVYAAYDPELDRRVAIKLLRADLAPDNARAGSWLLREAKALARLSHPNVVAVYDVGAFGDAVFLAMEFLRGQPLDEWLRAQPRPWREILHVFIDAGRGLAAAHAVGLVHRDFKPQNVIVDARGRVKVVDFGLARPLWLGSGFEDDPIGQAVPLPRLTRSGAIAGTPAYMAPEQHAGAEPDPRSDQFSFCLALCEALYGERPFPGETEEELRTAKESGRMREPPGSASVPVWLRRALTRGLAGDPGDRFPSMDALLAELTHDRQTRRRRIVAVIAAVAAIAGAVVLTWATREDPSLLCKGAERKLSGIWDPPRRRAVRASFETVKQPFAAAAWRGTERQLDQYARNWVARHTQACEATRVRGELSRQALDLRMGCLSRRLRDFGALIRVFLQADARVVQHAVAAAHALTSPDTCLDAAALRSRTSPPGDPVTKARVTRIRTALADARALQRAGKLRAGLREIRKIAARLKGLAYKPLIAEVMLLWGELEEQGGKAKIAEAKLFEALWAAQASHYDRVAARAAIQIVHIIGYWLAQFDRAERWTRHAAAAVERLGHAPVIEGEMLRTLGGLHYLQGRYAKALVLLRRSLELRRRALGPEHPDVALGLNDVGLVLWMLGRHDESLDFLRRSLALNERVHGPNHPDVSISLNNLGLVLHARGDYQKAVAHFERALAIREAVMGPEHSNVSTVLSNIGRSLRALGRYDEALARQRRGLAIREKVHGKDSTVTALSLNNVGKALSSQRRYDEAVPLFRRAVAIRMNAQKHDHPDLAYPLRNLGAALRALGRIDEARAHLSQALAIARKSFGKSHANLPAFLNEWGAVLAAQGRFREALAQYRRALAIGEHELGPNHPVIAATLTAIGSVHLRQHRPEPAAVALERALRIRLTRSGEPLKLARTRLLLARARWDGRRDRKGAVRLARLAHRAYRKAGRWFRGDAARAGTWLARFTGPPRAQPSRGAGAR